MLYFGIRKKKKKKKEEEEGGSTSHTIKAFSMHNQHSPCTGHMAYWNNLSRTLQFK